MTNVEMMRGSAVVVEGRYPGTHKQTGRKLDAQVCHVRKMRNGKIPL